MKNTLKENRDFRRLYGRGRSAVSDCLVLYTMPNRYGPGRLGITTGTKLGHAVVRNRIRRLIREIYRLNYPNIRPDMDVVVVARFKAVSASYRDLEKAFIQCAEKTGLMQKKAHNASEKSNKA